MTGTHLRQYRLKLGLSQAKLAELSGISQHLISAFELEKEDLPNSLLTAISQALADNEKVTQIVKRSKRYQQHKYVDAQKLDERLTKARRTVGNEQYVRILADLAERHTKEKNRALSALSLFSGCGGFSFGFSAAGFLVKGFLELEKDLRKIYKHNFAQALELGSDITKIDRDTLLRISEQLGTIDVIIGGPPCQGFSLSGKRQVDDPRNSLFKHYLRFVDVIQPKIAVMENVRLLTSMKGSTGRFIKNEICDEFRKHGYNIQYFEINAKDYGVPQHRERVLFIALRNDLDALPTLPERTHGEGVTLFSTTFPYRTFADACSDLPFIESGEKSADPLHEAVKHPAHVLDWLWDVPEGRSAHDNEETSKRPPSGYNTTYKRQVWNEPASTVQTTFGMISGCRNVHPIATRSLTIREAARIQSFPDSYIFRGNLGIIRTGIGNAVPPMLAYAIALHVKKVLFNFVEVASL